MSIITKEKDYAGTRTKNETCSYGYNSTTQLFVA